MQSKKGTLENLTVGKLIKLLSAFDADMEVAVHFDQTFPLEQEEIDSKEVRYNDYLNIVSVENDNRAECVRLDVVY